MGVSQVNHATTATHGPAPRQPATWPVAWIAWYRWETRQDHNKGGRMLQAPVHGGCPKAQCLPHEPAGLQQGMYYVAVGLLGCMNAHRPARTNSS